MYTLSKGERISNYLLEAPLGQGSFGEVWRARHHVFDDVVAIKIPTDPQYVRNLQREGLVVHGLKHPNVVRAIDLDPYATPPYLVMEFIDGPTLREAIDKLKDRFPLKSAIAIEEGILRALDAAHKTGLLHRDIKPANIMLAHPLDQIETITPGGVKVTDFGLGRVGGDVAQSILISGQSETEGGRNISGTLAYMSPEQREGRDLDGRSDLYACGVVLFEMLTGERPQGHDLPTMLRRQLPKQVDEFFKKAYARQEKRYKDAQEMIDDLLRIPTELVVADQGSVKSPPPPPQTWPPGHAHKKEGICSSCNTPVLPEDQFCIACGRCLVEVVPRCPQCNGFVGRNDLFCIFCGQDLRRETA